MYMDKTNIPGKVKRCKGQNYMDKTICILTEETNITRAFHCAFDVILQCLITTQYHHITPYILCLVAQNYM